MTSKDIIVTFDRDGGGIVLNDPDTKDARKNYQRVSSVTAQAMKIMRDDIVKLQGLAKKKGKA